MDITKIPHISEVSACHGEYDPANCPAKSTIRFDERQKNSKKVLPSLEEAIRRSGLKDGMTISFHHHFRNGDFVVNMVVDQIAKMGIKNLTLAASSLTDCHWPLIEHIKNGVITHIETSGLRGKLAEAVSRGLMDFPVIFRSHGGRAAAIESGELHIDVAFLGAPSCDPYGNANGYNRDDENASCCGSLGYAMLDAQHADKCIIITDHLVNFPNAPFAIPESRVDWVVVVDNIGDPKGIMSGATRYTKNPKELLIAKTAAQVIEASGYFEDNFTMQMGSGGASLATARFLRERMIEKGIKCRFALGGITGQIVQMHEEGLVKKILDVQSFDLIAANSVKNNRFHQQINASYYASYENGGAAVNQLDFVILSALEIDVNFNVNVMTGSDGVIRGAVGGHPDTAAGASLTVVTAPLLRGRIPTVCERVNTICTPGSTIDVLVTDQGVAVNPSRPELREKLIEAGLPVTTIEKLKERAERVVGKPEPIEYTDRIVGVLMYRNNTVIDVIHQIKED
ncbi:MAG: citrate lyase subunit alpha [Clostridia bacterium]|nr:citrate lyase subunit alpha [Clostridia bacterium]MBQ2192090.1 citrate lyase subunit alpha [Clostridia bacterium]MBQ5488722.1 citrate lyase subunit alpha [Clostridia bacterium]